MKPLTGHHSQCSGSAYRLYLSRRKLHPGHGCMCGIALALLPVCSQLQASGLRLSRQLWKGVVSACCGCVEVH
jgi:hypothetical protein